MAMNMYGYWRAKEYLDKQTRQIHKEVSMLDAS